MTVIEAISKAEEILGTIPVSGRDNVKKVNIVFDLLDASIAAFQKEPPIEKEEGENGTVC